MSDADIVVFLVAHDPFKKIPRKALAEKVIRRELREEHAVEIGRMILRENAIGLYSRLRAASPSGNTRSPTTT